MKVSVSFIKSNYKEEETIKKINESIADYLHIDIMDGVFVDIKNYDFTTISYYVNNITKPLDVHLMVSDVDKYVKEYVLLKPEYITIHYEATNNLKEIIDYIHANNIKAGLAINPDTLVDDIIPFLNDIDLVLVMSVYPGAGGQKFIMDVINKINKLKELQKDYNYIINVDGGVNEDTIKYVNSDMVVSGSYVCCSTNFDEKINKLK